MTLSTTGLSLAADAAIDLHLHTTYSDGRWTPEPLLDHLFHEQFALAAISDHDRADTAAAVQQLALDKHLPLLVAVEMTTTWKGQLTDLLLLSLVKSCRPLSRKVVPPLLTQERNLLSLAEMTNSSQGEPPWQDEGRQRPWPSE